MILEEQATYYDILELTPDASPQELRAAYLRAKSAFKKDSAALYTLISEEETELLLKKIEEAYEILSNPERRKAYDRSHGLLDLANEKPEFNKVISIDRVPPMENIGSEADVLVAPTTDIPHDHEPRQLAAAPAPAKHQEPVRAAPHPPIPLPIAEAIKPEPVFHSSDPMFEQALGQEIAAEVEWRGHFLRKIREARRISLEELSENTKISRSYIVAIEDENFSKLPAPVYLRGFVMQIARLLKLPADKVTSAYLARYHQARSKDS